MMKQMIDFTMVKKINLKEEVNEDINNRKINNEQIDVKDDLNEDKRNRISSFHFIKSSIICINYT